MYSITRGIMQCVHIMVADISSSDENDSKKRKGNEEASKSQDQVDRRR